jgi:hypothetical protein
MLDQAIASCPSCRKRITIPPSVPSVSLEKIIRSLVGTKLENERKEYRQRINDAEMQVVEILRKCGDKPWDWFQNQKPILDADDGVYRCPVCVWELSSDGSCSNPTCGRVWEIERRADADDDDADDADGSDEEEGENDYDSQDSFICDEVEKVTDSSSSSESGEESVQVKSVIRPNRDDDENEEEDADEARDVTGSENDSENEEEAGSDSPKLSKAAQRLQQRRLDIKKAREFKAKKLAKKIGEGAPEPHSGNKSGGDERLPGQDDSDDQQCSDQRAISRPKKRRKEKSPPAEVDELPRRKKPKKQRSLPSEDEDPHAAGDDEIEDTGGGRESEKREDALSVQDGDENEERDGSEDEDDSDDEPCRVCGETGNSAETLLCDRCDRPFHTWCVGLSEVPEGKWYCRRCTRKRARQ